MSVTAALEHLWVAASLNLKVRFLSLLFLKFKCSTHCIFPINKTY